MFFFKQYLTNQHKQLLIYFYFYSKLYIRVHITYNSKTRLAFLNTFHNVYKLDNFPKTIKWYLTYLNLKGILVKLQGYRVRKIQLIEENFKL